MRGERSARGIGADDALCVGAYLVAILTRNPFPDPDLGWHVAGGLWMLETWRIPTADPFSAQGGFWLCYSWLAELLFAAAYELGGFVGLNLFEVLVRVAMTAMIIGCARSFGARAAEASVALRRASQWLTIAVVLAFVLPMTRLRPQTFSWMLFALLIVLSDRRRLRLALLAPLTIVWANVHVFWVFVPLFVFLHTVLLPRGATLESRLAGVRLSAATLALGLVNPYGWRVFAALWDLFLHHGTADALIFELAPMTIHYESFWLYAATLLGVALCLRRTMANEAPAHLATFLLFAAASAHRIKYLPLFALAAAPLLVRQVFPALLGAARALGPLRRVAPAVAETEVDRGRTARALVLGLLAWALAAPLVARSAPLPTPHRELFDIARRLAASPSLGRAGPVPVLNDANYGGWLELAFWLVRPPGATEPMLKPAMDNRTLVISQERIREYDQLRQMSGDWPHILSRWGIRVAILPSRAVIVPALQEPAGGTSDVGAWETIYASNVWTVLVRRGPQDLDRPVTQQLGAGAG